MPIWPKRLAQRVVAIAAESCTEPIMNARRVEFRNGINAIAFVAMKMIAGDDEPRSRYVSWGGGSMRV